MVTPMLLIKSHKAQSYVQICKQQRTRKRVTIFYTSLLALSLTLPCYAPAVLQKVFGLEQHILLSSIEEKIFSGDERVCRRGCNKGCAT